MARPFHYEPLNYEARLLRIEKGDGPELRCKILRIESLEKMNEKYEALSYTWDSDKMIRNITIISGDDYNFPVTENCYNAIKRLRRTNNSRTVWIDAVCINRDDISERNQQVEIMPRIYKNAKTVLVYLGESRNSSEEAMKSLIGERDGFPTALKDLIEHPWFKSIWVLQEMYNDRPVRVLCRDRSVEWSLNAQLWKGRLAEKFPNGEHPRVLLIRDGSHTSPSPSRKLIDLLLDSRFCNCMDPRDRIFALLPMSTDSSRDGLKVDYGTNVEDLYILAATQFLRHGHLNTIYSVDRHQVRDEKLPSWVTDWRTLRSCTPITKLAKSSYQYSRDSFPKPEGSILKFRGQRVATLKDSGVKSLGRAFQPDSTGWDQACMDDWYELFGKNFPDSTGTELEKILSMSLKRSSLDLLSTPRQSGRAYVQREEDHLQVRIRARIERVPDREPPLQNESGRGPIAKALYTKAMGTIKDALLAEIRDRKFLGLERPGEMAAAGAELNEERWKRDCRAKTKETQKLVPSLMRAFKRTLERSVLPLLPENPIEDEFKAVGRLARNLFHEVITSLENDRKLSRSGSFLLEEHNVLAISTFEEAMAQNVWETPSLMRSQRRDWDDPKKISTCCKGRRLFVDSGHVGLVPGGARNDDPICAINGSRFPFLLREKSGHYVLIGACYVVPTVPIPTKNEEIEFDIR